jgi:hypothetical protein
MGVEQMKTNQEDMFGGVEAEELETAPRKNKIGKPKDVINHEALMLRSLLNGEAEAIARKAIEKALGGDSTAIRTVLERVLPARKDALIKIKLPHIKNTKDVTKAVATIIDAVANGEITPNEGKALTSLIEDFRKSYETENIEDRLYIIEERLSVMKEKEQEKKKK